MRLPRLLGVLVVATAVLPVHGAAASSYPVTSVANSGAGSLRAAIEAANDPAEADTIPISATGTIKLTEALPLINDDVAIVGPGAGSLTVERVALMPFGIFGFSSSATTASLSGLTVSNGLAEVGAGIYNSSGNLTLTDLVVRDNEAVGSGGAGAFASGGGIFSVGPLTVRESVVSGNVAEASNGSTSAAAQGGGILAYAGLTIEASTVSGNTANAENGGTAASAFGGGVLVQGKASIVARSTISGNTVSASGGGVGTSAGGGGIHGQGEGEIGFSLTSSTVTGNAAISDDVAAGANLQLSGTHRVRNTIVADPVGAANCASAFASGGFNLDQDGSCGFGKPTDQKEADPLLDPVLRENGGPTPTHALLLGSAAIDRGNAFGSAADQRGLSRPVDFSTVSNTEGGDGSDIGAFELQSLPSGDQAPPPPLLVRLLSGDRLPPNTRILKAPPRVTYDRLARFHFNSTEAQSSFQCKLDKRRWRACLSPYKRMVSAGAKHVFQVRAIDRFGNFDRSPARFGWRVKKIGR